MSAKQLLRLHITSMAAENPAMAYFKAGCSNATPCVRIREAIGMQGWKLHVHEESLWDLYRSRA